MVFEYYCTMAIKVDKEKETEIAKDEPYEAVETAKGWKKTEIKVFNIKIVLKFSTIF